MPKLSVPNGRPEGSGQPPVRKREFVPELIVSGINTPVCVQLLVDKPKFVLGKAPECEGRLSFNSEISRQHCEIDWEGGAYVIRDLHSTNHTYLNGVRLEADRPHPIHPGDRLRLSTFTFEIDRVYNATKEQNNG